MDYQIRIVEDNELPAGTGWVVARRAATVYLLMTRTRYARGDLDRGYRLAELEALPDAG